MTARKLKTTEVAAERQRLLLAQGGKCAICQLPIRPGLAVLDHDHATGAVRAVLHRGCNSLLGKLENNAARYGVASIGAFTSGVARYLLNHMTNITGLVHPLHKTEDEKRELRNKRARVARARKKAAA